MDCIIKTLDSLEPLNNKEAAALREALGQSRPMTLRKGQYLWQQGEVARLEAYVVNGILREFVTEDNGNEKIIQFYQEEDFVNECSGQPAMHSAQALEDCDLIIIKNTDWERFALEFPVLERIGRKLAEIQMVRHQEHLNMLMKSAPEERYNCLLNASPGLVKRISVTHLAQYLGISRETLSRTRAKIYADSIL